jgi:hypothetical protein
MDNKDERSGMNRFQRFLARRLIPKGLYCDGCPFWFVDKTHPEQENGYCSYLGKGDWDLNAEIAEKDVEVRYGDKVEIMKYKDLPPSSLLWDGCKECGVKEF